MYFTRHQKCKEVHVCVGEFGCACMASQSLNKSKNMDYRSRKPCLLTDKHGFSVDKHGYRQQAMFIVWKTWIIADKRGFFRDKNGFSVEKQGLLATTMFSSDKHGLYVTIHVYLW